MKESGMRHKCEESAAIVLIIETAKYFPLSHVTLAEGGLDSIAIKEKKYLIVYIVDK